MKSGSELPARITFGRFCLMPYRRELLYQDQSVRLGGRAFDVLIALIEARGSVVSKDALMARVWPNQMVEENNLEVQISALRAVFGAERALIRTVARRGYQFTGKIRILAEDGEARVTAVAPATNLPQPVSGLIGRDENLLEVLRFAAAYRLVTLTGTGGIGKTRLALAVAHRLLPQFDGSVYLVDLGPLSDPGLVAAAVATAVGLELAAGAVTAERVANALTGNELLLVLDNCEHLIDAAAIMTEALLRANSSAGVIATSREPLRAEGERVYSVPALAVPAADMDDKSDPLDYGAIRLFVERALATEPQFTPDARLMALIAVICRRLDGIPLAIELAAARAATLGVEELADRLDERFNILNGGRRTALPRHRTLRATLDWSYELLPEAEQQLLCRLAMFPAGFSLDAAVAVMGDAAAAPSTVTDGIANLINKSLVFPERPEGRGRWRLLETTRAYALEKLAETGDAEQVARYHAEFYLALFAPFSTAGGRQAAADVLSGYRRDIDNLRAALNWAFSPQGDTALGVRLTAAATVFWVAVSQVEEASEWADKALALIGEATGTRYEMILQCNLGVALMYTRGMIASSRTALTRALALAQELGDFDYQQHSIRVLWLFSARAGASNETLVLARQYEELTRGRDDQLRAMADLMVGISQIYLAAYGEAGARLQRAIDRYPVDRGGSYLHQFNAEVRVGLAVSLLSRGSLEAASHMAMSAIEEVRGTNDVVHLCVVLAWMAGTIFLRLSQLEIAERYSEELIDHAARHALRPFHAAGLCVRGSLAAKRGDPESGLDPLRRGLAEMQEVGYLLFYPLFKAELALALGGVGRVDDGLAEIDEALSFTDKTDGRWFVPEILRAKGELFALRGSDSPTMIVELFLRSMNQARSQQALFWELRAAMSLARLFRDLDQPGDALACLQPVYDRFSEGFGTFDLITAKRLLDELRLH
jgi:non-specific serine/threonine protein kinase